MELIDVFDENGIATGKVVEKNEAHTLGLWHVTAHIWIYNLKEELLLQKRSENKSTFPGMWDISVAGHISAGETVEIGAKREIKEEIGLDININDLKKIFVHKESNFHKKHNWTNNEFYHVFLYEYNGDISNFVLQEEEVDSVKFISIENLEKIISNPSLSKNIIGNSEYYYKIITAVKKELNKE